MESIKLEKKSKVLLIIPAYNEEKSILETVKQIDSLKKCNPSLNFDLDFVVINDGSTDRTSNLLKENDINCINLICNLGIGGAVQTGYKYAAINNYDIAVQFDADGQHDINSLNNIVEPIIDNKCDFCVGSRFVEKDLNNFQSSFMRRFGIKFLSFLIKLVTGRKIYDVTSGYRAANREVVAFFCDNYPTNYPEPESLVHLIQNNFSTSEQSVRMFERKEGKSSISSLKSIRYMAEVSTAILITGLFKERN